VALSGHATGADACLLLGVKRTPSHAAQYVRFEASRLEDEPEIVERRPHGLIVIGPVDLTDPSLRDTGAARTSFDQLLYRRGKH